MSRPETVVAGGMDGRDFEAHQAISETRASEQWAGYIPAQTEPGRCWVARPSVREEADDRVRQRHPDQTLERRKPESMTVHRDGHERAVDGDVSSRKQSPVGSREAAMALRWLPMRPLVSEVAVETMAARGPVGNEPLKMGDPVRAVTCFWENPRSAARKATRWSTLLSMPLERGWARRKASQAKNARGAMGRGWHPGAVARSSLRVQAPRSRTLRPTVMCWRGPNPMRGGSAEARGWSGAGRSTHARAGRGGSCADQARSRRQRRSIDQTE